MEDTNPLPNQSTQSLRRVNKMENNKPSLAISKQQWMLIIVAVLVSRAVLYGTGLIGTHAYNPETVANLDLWKQICRFDCMWFQRIADDGYALVPTYMKGAMPPTGHLCRSLPI